MKTATIAAPRYGAAGLSAKNRSMIASKVCRSKRRGVAGCTGAVTAVCGSQPRSQLRRNGGVEGSEGNQLLNMLVSHPTG